jgi:hypothetical protein
LMNYGIGVADAFAAESRAANIQPCLTISRSRMTTKIAHGLVLPGI